MAPGPATGPGGYDPDIASNSGAADAGLPFREPAWDEVVRALDGAGLGIVVGDLDGVLRWVNEPFARRLGYTPGELVGESADRFMSADQRRRAHEHRRRSRTGDLREHPHDLHLLAADGSPVSFRVMRVVIDDEHGRPTWSLSIAQDLTELDEYDRELTRADEHLSSLVDTMPVGMLRWDATGTIVLARGRALAVAGLDADELVGTPVQRLVEHRPVLADRLERLLSTGGELRELIDFDAETIEFTIRAQGAGDGTGTEPGTGGGMVVGLVVTERERAKRRTEALAELGRAAVAAGGDVDAVLEVIARVISDQLAAVGIVALFEEATVARRFAIHHDDPEFVAHATRLLEARPLHRDGPVVAEALRADGPVVAEGPTIEPYRIEGTHEIGTRILTPISVDGEPVGVAVAASHAAEDRTFDDADRSLLATLADRAGAAIGQALVLASRDAREQQQTAVAELGERALAGEDFGDLARRCVDLVYRVLGEPCVVYLEDGHPDGQLIAAARGLPEEIVRRNRSSRDPGTPLGALLASAEPTISDDIDHDPRFRPPTRPMGRSAAGASINSRSGPIGAVCALSPTVGRFTSVDASMLSAMANVLAAAWDAERAAEELRHNALHDALTGLPNRALLDDRLHLALDQSLSGQVGVIVCDLDHFKLVNDSHGHGVGDEVLEQVAARLGEVVRTGDTVARFGGDEFVIVCPEVDDESEVIAVSRRIADALEAPIELAAGRVFTTASMGITVGSAASTPNDLIRDADTALYRAKERGRDRWEIFDETLRIRALHRLETEGELRRALEEDQFVLHYQPITAFDSGRVLGVEALIRWDHPERGILGPGEFMPVAEQTGLIVEIGAWVLEEAARQTAEWVRDGVWDRRTTSINVAAAQMDESLPVRIHNAAAAVGLAPSALRVEITETVLLHDTKAAEAVLGDLRRIGVQTSIDDFGTGYSSLAYLADLSVDSLKIDRTFVQGLVTTEAGRAITEAVIELSHALHLRSIAEGVETIEQVDALRDLGADAMQGFLVARPEPAAAVAERVRARS